ERKSCFRHFLYTDLARTEHDCVRRCPHREHECTIGRHRCRHHQCKRMDFQCNRKTCKHRNDHCRCCCVGGDVRKEESTQCDDGYDNDDVHAFNLSQQLTQPLVHSGFHNCRSECKSPAEQEQHSP